MTTRVLRTEHDHAEHPDGSRPAQLTNDHDEHQRERQRHLCDAWYD
jgi:hypothetical protein